MDAWGIADAARKLELRKVVHSKTGSQAVRRSGCPERGSAFG